MELSSSSCEKQILHDVCDVCVDVAGNQSSFSVKWPLLDLEPINETEQSSYCVQLMKRLNIQRQQIHFCNITLVAKEGRKFKAHRNVLSAASPFFSKLLQSEMKEREEGVIRFEEISKSILSDVLEFIYTGSVEINEKNARDLIIAADYLLLESLKTISGRFVEKQMTIGNCISTFYFAEKYRCEELVLRSTKFIQDNFTSVAKSDEFLNLEAEEVEKWISSENILVAAEEDVFRIILNWVEQNKRERKDEFKQLFRHVRLVLLSHDSFFSNVVTNELVTGHFSLTCASRRRLETDAIVVRGRKKTYCYLPEKDEWKRLADGLSEDRNHTTPLIKFRDHLYSFGRYAQTAERYDPGFNSWTTLKLSLPNETFSLAVVNGQIHVMYRIRSRRAHQSSTSAPVIKRYNEELFTWETSITGMTRVSLVLATVSMFLVVDIVTKLAGLILRKANGRKLHMCQFQSIVPVVLLLKRGFLSLLQGASNVKCTRFPQTSGIPFQVRTLPDFFHVVWCVLTKQFMYWVLLKIIRHSHRRL